MSNPTITTQIAKHLRDVYFGGNWATSNFKDSLADVTWQQATTPVHSSNTIATLIYHTGYYIQVQSKVLQGLPLVGKDSESFDHPAISSQKDWEQLLHKTFTDADAFANLIEQLPDSKLAEDFSDKKYGTYYRNLTGIIEHLHYHLGQIVLIKKIVQQGNKV
ncbi:MAG: DinB family protein [Bacteroidota bacterium]